MHIGVTVNGNEVDTSELWAMPGGAVEAGIYRTPLGPRNVVPGDRVTISVYGRELTHYPKWVIQNRRQNDESIESHSGI